MRTQRRFAAVLWLATAGLLIAGTTPAKAAVMLHCRDIPISLISFAGPDCRNRRDALGTAVSKQHDRLHLQPEQQGSVPIIPIHAGARPDYFVGIDGNGGSRIGFSQFGARPFAGRQFRFPIRCERRSDRRGSDGHFRGVTLYDFGAVGAGSGLYYSFLLKATSAGSGSIQFNPTPGANEYAANDTGFNYAPLPTVSPLTFNIAPAVVPPPPPFPEPSSLALLALGGVALAGWRRWKTGQRQVTGVTG